MSASSVSVAAKYQHMVSNNTLLLAPAFRTRLLAGIAECHAVGYDVVIFECVRSNELAQYYYQEGRTIKPPSTPITNAPDASWTWHGYALASDLISAKYQWSPPQGDAWFAAVAEIMKRHNLEWGGDWKTPDLPHFQFGGMKASPSATSRALYTQNNIQAVWKLVDAA